MDNNSFCRYFDEQKEETLTRVKCDTERHRMGYATIEITDGDGKSVDGVKVSAKQISHEFKFGCNSFMLDQFPDDEHNRKYREIFPKLFNYAIVPFYWSDFEPEDGKPRINREDINIYRRPAPEKVIAFCKQNNIKMKGHPLFWHSFVPEWFDMNKDTAMERIDRHIKEICEAYGSDIGDWDVVNESLTPPHLKPNIHNLPKDYVKKCFDCAKKYLTSNRLFINETTHVWDWWYFNYELGAYYMQIENLLMKGAKIDAIGLQYHMFSSEEKLRESAKEYYNPQRLFDVMDSLAGFNLPLHISEVTVPAYGGGEKAMQKQAEITEWLYRIWFSHPNAECIVWWNMVDGTAAYAPLGSSEGENFYHGGLLNYDMSPKPVCDVLDRLINHEWHTEGELCASGGRAKLHGFYGDYEISVEHNGKVTKEKISFTKNGKKVFKIAVDK